MNAGKPEPSERAKKMYEQQMKDYERDARLRKYQLYRGSGYQALGLEKGMEIRDRMAAGFVGEDQQWRKRFLQERHLAPDEPRFVPELRPRNVFRRLLSWPWDVAFNGLKMIAGDRTWVSVTRRYFPRAIVWIGGCYAFLYYVVSHQSDWETTKGVHIFRIGKDEFLPVRPGSVLSRLGDERWREKPVEPSRPFCDDGFAARQALRDSSDNSTNPRNLFYSKFSSKSNSDEIQ